MIGWLIVSLAPHQTREGSIPKVLSGGSTFMANEGNLDSPKELRRQTGGVDSVASDDPDSKDGICGVEH